MSVLIKGMEIPKDSKYVDVRIFRDGTATTSTAEEPFYKKMDVIEVPPHGRLIDADQIINAIYHDYEEGGVTVEAKPIDELLSEMCNETAPTIIEAEKL